MRARKVHQPSVLIGKPVMKNKDVWSRKPTAETKSSLCSDKNCQSTRCIKKAKRCLSTKIAGKSMCGDELSITPVYVAREAQQCHVGKTISQCIQENAI